MNICKLRSGALLALFILCRCALVSAQTAPQQQVNKNTLLYWASRLEEHIDAKHTAYRHEDNTVTWGQNGDMNLCYADCSGFINALISKADNWTTDDFKNAFGHKRMYAYHYFDAISAENHFKNIRNIKDILPGDLIALKYNDRSEHEDNTGHVMLIASLPQLHKQSKIIEPNTTQYEIEVIDCTTSPHGKADTRFTTQVAYTGLGEGTIRLYTDMQGNITAYSWSTGNPKEGFDPYANPVVVGRFMPGK